MNKEIPYAPCSFTVMFMVSRFRWKVRGKDEGLDIGLMLGLP